MAGAEKPKFSDRKKSSGTKTESEAVDPDDVSPFFGAGAGASQPPAKEEADDDDVSAEEAEEDNRDEDDQSIAESIDSECGNVDDDAEDIDNISHTISSLYPFTQSDRIVLNKKQSTVIVPVFSPKLSSMEGRRVAVASIFLPEQLSQHYIPHISDGGRSVVITFPRNADNYEEFFLSTVTPTGVLKELWVDLLTEEMDAAVAKNIDISQNYGSERMIFKLPFKAEEDFFGGLFPSTDVAGQRGIAASHMTNTVGTSSGVVLTFGVIEKISLAQKIKSPVARKPEVKNVSSMKSSAHRARQQAHSYEYAARTIDAQREQLEREQANVRRREQQMAERERAYNLLLQQQQAASSAQQHSSGNHTSGNTRSHEEMNDLGNVQMGGTDVIDDSDDVSY